MIFESFESIINIMDYAINTKRRRHLVGGMLLSVSFLFGGLALTTMTMDLGKEKGRNVQERETEY